MEQKMWILVANQASAKIFSTNGLGKHLVKVQDIDHPEGRLRDQDINSDRPGRTHESVGFARHAMTPVIDPHFHEMQVFIHQLQEVLRKAYDAHDFQRLSLIAPPQFIGEFRRTLPENLKKSIFKEVTKDLSSHLSEFELEDSIRKYLELGN